jgi:SAM-dependent methyltransferase
MSSPAYSEDFPTPRPPMTPGRQMQQRMVPSPISEVSDSSADWKRSHGDDFDELYDVTDDESFEVPLKCSASVKKLAEDARASSRRTSRNRYPSLIIPSPSSWPTIQKLKSAVTPMSPTGPMQVAHSPGLLSILSSRCLQVPAPSATPSLDGSMTSEEMASISCPSTPDLEGRRTVAQEWGVQLRPEALETLNHLSVAEAPAEMNTVIELQPEIEMAEVQQARPLHTLNTTDESDEAPFSPLSVPSPGGFFSSLGGSARDTWSSVARQPEPLVPSTCVAEQFYGVPWRQSSDEPVPRTIEVTLEPADEPSTAKLTLLSGSTEVEVPEVREIAAGKTIFEYQPNYEKDLQKMAAANLDRTGSWLNSQLTYLNALRETSPLPEPESPSESSSTHTRNKSLEGSASSPSKKSVRFLDEAPKSPASATSEKSDKESVFAEAFEYLAENSYKTDAYIHRQTRADAFHIMRRHLSQSYKDQLLGRYEITAIARPAPPRPVSSFYTDDPTVLKERIARAQKERQALDQVKPAHWVLQAQKYLNGGKLISKPASKALHRSTNARVLDVGGQSACDWAWELALDCDFATVHTVSTSIPTQASNIEGPANHKHTVIPNYWTFPFPSQHFDVVSVRSLHSQLKAAKPCGSKIDEFDLCLRECHRVLKKGGFLDFSLIDADIVHAGALAQAASAEFSFNLKTRGYDPAPTKSFLPRLKKAGFEETQRSWTFLPMGKTAAKWNDTLAVGATDSSLNITEKTISPEGDVSFPDDTTTGSTQDIAALTGMVGSWAWERWLIKLQVEMGKEEERLLEGVPAVLEESARSGAGWRHLGGWARKGF